MLLPLLFLFFFFFHMQQASRRKNNPKTGSNPGQSVIPRGQSFQDEQSLVPSPRGGGH